MLCFKLISDKGCITNTNLPREAKAEARLNLNILQLYKPTDWNYQYVNAF